MTKMLDYPSHVPTLVVSLQALARVRLPVEMSSPTCFAPPLHLSAGWLLFSSQRKHCLLQDALPPLQAGLGVSPLHIHYPIINGYFLST